MALQIVCAKVSKIPTVTTSNTIAISAIYALEMVAQFFVFYYFVLACSLTVSLEHDDG